MARATHGPKGAGSEINSSPAKTVDHRDQKDNRSGHRDPVIPPPRALKAPLYEFVLRRLREPHPANLNLVQRSDDILAVLK